MAEAAEKVALITAAAQGIGKSTALRLAREGYKVIATDVNKEALKSLEGIPNVSVKVLDVTDKEAIEELAKEIEKIDVLFNCAGYVHQGNIFECNEATWDKSFDINVKSMYLMCHAFMPKVIQKILVFFKSNFESFSLVVKRGIACLLGLRSVEIFEIGREMKIRKRFRFSTKNDHFWYF